MTYPRAHLIDSETPCFYHLISRCVRRAWLCGEDPITGRSYEHRRAWIENRILFLAKFFAVDIYAYAVMSNHYHIVLYFDPTEPSFWSDEEVVRRWLSVAPVKRKGRVDDALTQTRGEELLANPDQVAIHRERLGNLSWFMRMLNHPLACRANREDDCTGHFWEGRFKSALLLDESAVISCMAYVDLNPVRAKIAHRFEDCQHTSIKRRLEHPSQESDQIAPVTYDRQPTVTRESRLSLTLREYRQILIDTGLLANAPSPSGLWHKRVSSIGRVQRAYGSKDNLRRWVDRLGQRWSKSVALPG